MTDNKIFETVDAYIDGLFAFENNEMKMARKAAADGYRR
jgi:hypothetical protein